IFWSCSQKNTKDELNKKFETDMRNFIHEFTKATNVPGMGFAYYSDTVGTVILVVGKADIENNIPLELSTHYPIQSTTKMFISIVTLQLIEEGKLSLDSSIDQWIDSVPNNNNITIRHLLQHTSGLNPPGDEFIDEYFSNTEKKYTRDDFINAGLAIPYRTEDFGSYNYTNTNIFMLANIIESITKHTIGQEYDHRIFKPAKMSNTYYKPEMDNDTIEIIKCYKNGEPLNLKKMNFLSNAAGGIISTLGDMMKFAHWVLDNKYHILMSSELIQDFSDDDVIFNYGLGLQVINNVYGTTLLGHSGGNYGFLHELYFSTETGEIIIWFFNEGNPKYFPFRVKLDSIFKKYR
ncbi:MAG: serine hydrolase domain-containing protein, partial [Bacteroidales bacterium]